MLSTAFQVLFTLFVINSCVGLALFSSGMLKVLIFSNMLQTWLYYLLDDLLGTMKITGNIVIRWIAEHYKSQPHLPITGDTLIRWHKSAGCHKFQH